MALSVRDGGPAAACMVPRAHALSGHIEPVFFAGLSKRDAFAMHAPDVPAWFKQIWMNGAIDDATRAAWAQGLEHDDEQVLAQLWFSWRWWYADTMVGRSRAAIAEEALDSQVN